LNAHVENYLSDLLCPPPASSRGASTVAAAVAAPSLPPFPPLSGPVQMNARSIPRAEEPPQTAAVALLHRLARQADNDRPQRRAAERCTRWLRMRCDEQHYALELLKVQEVVLPATLLPLRGVAPHVQGVMNLRGQIVTVIDLGVYLGRAPIVDDASTRIVVLEEHGQSVGLRVSAVEDVAQLSEAQIENPDSTRGCGIAGTLLRGVARLGGKTVILLDATSILG